MNAELLEQTTKLSRLAVACELFFDRKLLVLGLKKDMIGGSV